MGIWDISHPPQISPTHILGHPSLRTARRLSISHLHSANILLGQSKRNGPLTVNTGGTTATCRQRSYSTSPKAICTPGQCISRISNAFQQERQASSIPPHHTEVSQSDLSTSLLLAQLERKPMLRLLSSSQVGNGGQHHLPLAAEGVDAAQSTAESKSPSWGCQAAMLLCYSSDACVTYLHCWFPSPSFPAGPGAVLTTHVEQLLCLPTVLGTAACSWRGLSPPISGSLYRPLGKS